MPLVIPPHLAPPQDMGQGVQAQGQVQGQAPQPGINPAQIGQVRQQGRQVTGQQPLRSLGPSMSTARQDLERATRQWIGATPRGAVMPKTLGVTMPPLGNTVQIDSKMVEHEINALPQGQRQDAVRDMPRVLRERINNGHRVWAGVSNGTLHGPASMEDVRDLMTFLLAKGMEKGDGFSEGAFNISDPGHQLRDFLDSCPEVYQRPSSHIEGFQQAPGGSHRGIDAHGGVTLPYGKATLLYGGMSAGVQGLGQDRLFLKTEEHGCRLSARWTPNRDPNIHDRPARLGDVGQFLGHAMGFFRTVLRGISGGRLFPNATDSRKERLPGDVSKSFNAILKNLDRSGQAEIAGILRQNEPLATSQGIRVMVANLDQALARQDLDQPTRDAMQRLRGDLATRFDHLDVRIGNEVILDQAELAGTPPQASTTELMRAAVKSLLTVPDPEHLSPDKVADFTRQLAKMAVNIDRADGDQGAALMGTALDAVTQDLPPEDRQHLAELLNAPQMRGMAAGMLDVMGMGGENLGAMPAAARTAAAQVAHKVAHAYIGLSTRVGLPNPQIGAATARDMALVQPILAQAGNDTALAASIGPAEAARAGQARLEQEPVGLMSMGDVRAQVGPGVIALGQHAQSIPRGEVDRAQIGQTLLTGIQTDLGTMPDDGLEGLSGQFVNDFLRNGVTVNGQRYGGQGTDIPDDEKRAHLQEFIQASGGLAKARHIARVATQARFGDMQAALTGDPGLGPLRQEFATYRGQTHLPVSAQTGQRVSMAVSVLVHGDNVAIRMENASQKMGDTLGTDYEMGENTTVSFTLQGAGSDDPVVRLDTWDALYSTTPQRRVTDMEQANLERGPEFVTDSRLEAMLDGHPPINRAAMTARLSTDLTAELHAAKDPGYRGLPDEFIRDFFRREITVNGQIHGGGRGVDGHPEGERQERLDAFIDAVGGEARARRIATMTYQNVPGMMEQALFSDPSMAIVVEAYMMHAARDVAPDVANFAITTRADGGVDVHLDYRQQRGEANGYEFGKSGYMDYRLSGLDTDAPTVHLQGWDMHFGTNPPR